MKILTILAVLSIYWHVPLHMSVASGPREIDHHVYNEVSVAFHWWIPPSMDGGYPPVECKISVYTFDFAKSIHGTCKTLLEN